MGWGEMTGVGGVVTATNFYSASSSDSLSEGTCQSDVATQPGHGDLENWKKSSSIHTETNESRDIYRPDTCVCVCVCERRQMAL